MGKDRTTEAKFDQYAARPVTDDYLASWMTSANAAVPLIRLGEFNWPMVVRSLIAEIERLRNEVASADERLRDALKTAESEARRYADFYPQSSDSRNTFIILADRIAEIANAE